MPLIFAIDSDKRQSEQLASLMRSSRLQVDLVQATSAGEGLHALQDRVPDLILTSPLLSPFDNGVLDEYLRELGTQAAHVQTLRIPVLSAVTKPSARSLFSLRRKKTPSPSATYGCDPKVFADEIALYLARAQEQRAKAATAAPSAPVAAVEPAADTFEPMESWLEATPDTPAAPEPELVYDDFAPATATQPIEEIDHHPHVARRETVDIDEQVEPEPILTAPRFEVADIEPIAAAAVDDVIVDDADPVPIIEHVDIPEAPETLAAPVLVAETTPVLVRDTPREIVQPPALAARPAPVAARPAASVIEPGVPSRPPSITSFETALAAIRAAWAGPHTDTTSSTTVPPLAAPAVPIESVSKVVTRPKAFAPVVAAPAAPPRPAVEVDLTGDIDALENLKESRDESESPGVDEDATSRRAPIEKKNGHKPPTKVPQAAGSTVQDEWGMFDPNQCGFSALVDKLDEVADREDGRAALTTKVRVISVG